MNLHERAKFLTRFNWVFLSTLFLQTGEYGNNEVHKNVLMKGLVLFAAIYKMHAELNLPIIYEKQTIGNIILLLVNQNRKFKKTVNLRAGRARKQRCTWFKQERIVLSRDNNAWRKTFECLVNCFMNLLVILSLIVVQITYRLIDEWSQWTKS